MARSTIVAVGAMLLVAWLGPPSRAQSATEPDDTREFAQHVDRLGRSLDEIAEALRLIANHQRIDLAMQRIALQERRVAPLERRLRNQEDDIRGLKDDLESMLTFRASLEEEVEKAVRAGANRVDIPEADELDRVDDMVRLSRDRVAAAATLLVELENNLARGQDRIEILDEQLEELLEELGD